MLGLTFPANLLGARSQPTPARLSHFLVHSSLQMRASDANDSVLSYSEQMKRGVYEQGRKN